MPKADDLIVKKEFRDLLDELTKEEYAGLEQEIVNGMKVTVRVWKGHNIIVDGHNGREICQKHSLPFEIEELPFDSEDAAKAWIIRNQYYRRNANPNRRRYHLAMLYELEKGKAGVPAGGAADAKVAKKAGVAPRTVRRAAKFKERVDKLDPDAKKAVLGGKAKLTPEPTRPAPGKKKKQGKVKFDFPEFNRCFGVVNRAHDALRDAYGDCGVPNEKWGAQNRVLREWFKTFESIKARALLEAGKTEKLEKAAAK